MAGTDQLEIESVFPKMPREVFEQYIKPQLTFEIDSLTVWEAFVSAPNWSKYFRNRPLHFWQNIDWVDLSVPYKDVLINKKTRDLAFQLVNDFGETGSCETAKRANVKDSKRRYLKCVSFMKQYRKFPRPVVCLEMQNGEWDLLDGFHRLAALLSVEDHENFPFEVWLGKDAI